MPSITYMDHYMHHDIPLRSLFGHTCYAIFRNEREHVHIMYTLHTTSTRAHVDIMIDVDDY
jgi:hypothetical protein